MKKLFDRNDFNEYFESTDSIVAASIANDKVEKFLIQFLKDPTLQASGDYAKGYRDCLHQLMSELEDK